MTREQTAKLYMGACQVAAITLQLARLPHDVRSSVTEQHRMMLRDVADMLRQSADVLADIANAEIRRES